MFERRQYNRRDQDSGEHIEYERKRPMSPLFQSSTDVPEWPTKKRRRY
jgi:hypothetical protein